jgi:hypothetical protein
MSNFFNIAVLEKCVILLSSIGIWKNICFTFEKCNKTENVALCPIVLVIGQVPCNCKKNSLMLLRSEIARLISSKFLIDRVPSCHIREIKIFGRTMAEF